ncbi:MAG TPA: archaeosortase/exosortase family protein [Patescibacteria group bacterium]|nr:archaeosortase/exosortase family protein [Patescibacteria group bacterium]
MAPGRPGLRFGAGFLVLVALCSTLTSSRMVGGLIHDHLTRWIATASAWLLAFLGPATALGSYVTFRTFGAMVEGACDGVQPASIFLCAVLAYPSRWTDKAWGIAIGVPVVMLINLVRVTTVVACGAYWPDLFERVHLYGWQALVIVLTIAVWVLWAELVVRPRDQALA